MTTTARPWFLLTQGGATCTVTYLTDERALDLLTHGIKLAPVDTGLVETIKLELAGA